VAVFLYCAIIKKSHKLYGAYTHLYTLTKDESSKKLNERQILYGSRVENNFGRRKRLSSK